MTDTDFLQPDPSPLRAAAEAAVLAQAVSGLVRIDEGRLAASGPLVPLARDIARSMTEAGTCIGTQQVMNSALGGMLRAFDYLVTPFRSGGAWIVTGRRGTEAGG